MTHFANALETKLASMRASISASNEKKMRAMIATVKSEKLCALLDESAIDAARFTRALYASEKVIKFAALATATHVDFAKINENAFAAFKTAINFCDAEKTLTKRHIEAAISRDVKIEDKDESALIARRNVILSADTLAAQSQQCVDMLKTLNIISEKSARSQSFTVSKNALATALAEKLITA